MSSLISFDGPSHDAGLPDIVIRLPLVSVVRIFPEILVIIFPVLFFNFRSNPGSPSRRVFGVIGEIAVTGAMQLEKILKLFFEMLNILKQV